MAKFVKSNSQGKLEVCIRRLQNDRNDFNKNTKLSQSHKSYIKEKTNDDWLKVIFNEPTEFEPEWVEEELQKAATGPKYETESNLKIFNFRLTLNSAICFIKLKSQISLDQFKRNCNKIPHPISGQACDVTVLPATTELPEIPVNLPLKWISLIKESLTKRYDSDSKTLDLSKFDSDSLLNSNGLWLSLQKPVIVREIANLLKSVDNIMLNCLNISDNNLTFVTQFVPLFEVVPIFSLIISGNSIVHRSLIRLLTCANGLRQLTMIGDCGIAGQKLKNKNSFIKELLENCQSLELFNNEDLRTDIFGGSRRLPPSKQSNEIADKSILDFFIDHALKIEVDRDSLIDYYSSDSILNIAVCYHDLTINNRRFTEVYLRNSRNLERLKDGDRRCQFIKQGSAQILGFFSEIPKLKHILSSFCVDVIVNGDESKIFTVNGLFVECCKVTNRNKIDNRESHNYYNLRMFSRAMIVVPPGKILQENWTITNPTDMQFRKYRQQFEDLKGPLESDRVVDKASTQVKREAVTTQSMNPLMMQQESLIQSLIQFSGMNHSFSLQCLQETNWNIDTAKEIFQQAFNNGKIPQEAFTK